MGHAREVEPFPGLEAVAAGHEVAQLVGHSAGTEPADLESNPSRFHSAVVEQLQDSNRVQRPGSSNT